MPRSDLVGECRQAASVDEMIGESSSETAQIPPVWPCTTYQAVSNGDGGAVIEGLTNGHLDHVICE
jgi:hypothetical protein